MARPSNTAFPDESVVFEILHPEDGLRVTVQPEMLLPVSVTVILGIS